MEGETQSVWRISGSGGYDHIPSHAFDALSRCLSGNAKVGALSNL